MISIEQLQDVFSSLYVTCRQTLSDYFGMHRSVCQSVKIAVGTYVQVINGAFEGYYASVVAKSYGDEWELNYFMEKTSYQGKYWVLKPNDLDSREECDLAAVKGLPDAKGRFTFEDI